MPFNVTICLPHLILECNQVTVHGKVVYSGLFIAGGRRDRRHNDFNLLFCSQPGESADLIHMFIAEKPVFLRKDNGSYYPLVHELVKTVEYLSLVNAFLPGYSGTFIK